MPCSGPEQASTVLASGHVIRFSVLHYLTAFSVRVVKKPRQREDRVQSRPATITDCIL